MSRPEYRLQGGRSLADQLRDRVGSLGSWWRSSLTVRVVTMVMAAGLIAMLAAGSIIVTQVRSQLFDRAVSAVVDEFESSRASAQARFDNAGTITSSEMQRIAGVVVAAEDPVRSVMGGAMLRSPDQEDGSFQILEPRSSEKIRSLISQELRSAVPESDAVHWQSISLAGSGSETIPGIMVGAPMDIPGAGEYEFYVAYSLENQEGTVRLVVGILTAGALVLVLLLALITWLVVGLVLRPVQEASRSARRLADGVFEARMVVRGDDELAHLAESFNQMAESLSDQFNRLERVSGVQQEFVSAVSHELRTPVTTIRMAGQLIYDKRDELPPGLRRSAELQHDQLINLDTTLSDLLEISRFDAGAMSLATEKADIMEIVERVVDSQAVLAESNGVDVVVVRDGDSTAKVEPRRIERIIRNLLVNALEHAEGNPVRVEVVGSDDAIAVEVSDRGVGLSPEQAEHVFDRFWRADTARVRKSGGTGLGLTIAREDALLHGGKLQCIGEEGVGATFLLSLPREPGEPWLPPLPLRVAALEDWEAWDAESEDEL